ncbi:hypothetical protein Tco_1549392 [Tanacetum coccineum]
MTKYKDHEMTVMAKGEVESEEEFEEETKTEEEEEDNPEHFDTFPIMRELGYYEWLLKNPQTPWVKAKIRTRNLNNVNFLAWLEPRRKPSNLEKICNFLGRVRGLKVFIGNFTYKCDFMMLEDTTSVIDHDLGSVVFGKPFSETTGLVYDVKEGTVLFEKDKEKIKNEEEIFTVAGDGVRIHPDDVTSPAM